MKLQQYRIKAELFFLFFKALKAIAGLDIGDCPVQDNQKLGPDN